MTNETPQEVFDEAVEELWHKGRQLVLTSNRSELKKLYARLTAEVCMTEGSQAAAKMHHELEELLLTPSRSVDWHIFDDL